jgi:hypothetical protein
MKNTWKISPALNIYRLKTMTVCSKNLSLWAAGWLVALIIAGLLAGCSDLPVGAYQPAKLTAQDAQVVPISQNQATPGYAGWAIDAYPDMSYEQMLAAVRRMQAAGANVIWISHANPARPFAQEREVGLNPSVFAAFKDPSQYAYHDAIAIVEANKRMLRACREAGIKAVLSVGYQTQMGQVWSAAHPQDLRRRANGKLWQVTHGNDPYGSIYSPTFQKDLRDYYVWLEFEIVLPFLDTIMMLNLADEPLGGDYSERANQEFRQRNGYGFNEIGDSTARQESLGRFQANVITDFMKLAAGYWNTITPGLPVTMSFDGGAMREENGFPNLESLFAEAPGNFVLTWDMYPRDRGTLAKPVNENDISRLFMLVRRIGGFSSRYNKPVWFWSAANSWGLGQTAVNPGTIGDAQANLLYLALLMNQTGGHLQGLAVWNYNIKSQGLYNYSCCGLDQKATWNEDDMFTRVSQQFETVRTIMTRPLAQPDILYLRPPEWQYRLIGQTRADYFLQLMDWGKMDALARYNAAGVEAGHWPEALPAQWASLKTVIALGPPEYYTPEDLDGLRNFAREGGTVVASLGLAHGLLGQDVSIWNELPVQQNYGKGRFFITRTPPNQLFNSQSGPALASFWKSLFGRTLEGSGYTIQTRAGYLQYQIGVAAGPTTWPAGWPGKALVRSDSNGLSRDFTAANGPERPLQRSEYVFGLS